MKPEESRVEWLKKAKEDREIAEQLLKGGKKFPSGAAFHSQQSAEKYLKAFLLHRGVAPPKVHSLPFILSLCVKKDKEFEFLRDLAGFLTQYGTRTRYPDEESISFTEARRALKAAKGIEQFVRGKVSVLYTKFKTLTHEKT